MFRIRTESLLAMALATAASVAHAEEMGREQVEVLEAYTAATAPKAKSADLFATFVNVETSDTLIGADSPASRRVDLVSATGEKRPYEEFRFEDDNEAFFRPGELHLRLTGLKQPLERGQSFLVQLHFAAGGTLPLTVTVK